MKTCGLRPEQNCRRIVTEMPTRYYDRMTGHVGVIAGGLTFTLYRIRYQDDDRSGLNTHPTSPALLPRTGLAYTGKTADVSGHGIRRV